MRREHEDKLLGSVETKVTPETCPQRDEHAKILGQRWGGCGETVPPGGMYPAEVVRRSCTAPAVEPPPVEPPPVELYLGHAEYREQNRLAWEKYADLNDIRTAPLFALQKAKEGRREIRRTSRFIDERGQVVEDGSAPARGRRPA